MGNSASVQRTIPTINNLEDSKFSVIVDDFDTVPILLACKNGNVTMLMHLLDVKGVDPNIGYVIEKTDSRFFDFDKAFEFVKTHKCVSVRDDGTNNIPCVIKYVEKYKYDNPLHIACTHNRIEIVKILLAKKVDALAINGCGKYKQPHDNMKRHNEDVTLFAACNKNGNPELVKLLLDVTTWNIEFVNKCISHVCENNYHSCLEILKLLIQSNIKIMSDRNKFVPMPEEILIAVTKRSNHADNEEITKLILMYSEYSLQVISKEVPIIPIGTVVKA